MKRTNEGAISPNEIVYPELKLTPENDEEIILLLKEAQQEQNDFPESARVWVCLLAYCALALVGLFVLYFKLNPEHWSALMDVVHAAKSSPARGWFT